MSGGYDSVRIELPWGATHFGIARASAEHRARGRGNRLNASGAVHPDFMHTVFVPKDATRIGTSSRKSLLKNRKKQAIARGAHPTPDEIVFSDTPGIVDDGNFSYGVCHVCDWKGGGRRAREKARRDAAEHYLLAH